MTRFQRKLLVLLGGILFCFQFDSLAQQNNTLYFMPVIPQASFLNPAYTTECNYWGLPLLSSLHFNYSNTAFSYNQLFPVKAGQRIPDGNYLASKTHNLDLVSTQFHTSLISIGFWYDEFFFSFHVTEKVDAFLSFPNTFFKVAWEGNTQYVGETVEIDRLGVNVNHRREYAVSASAWIDENLRIGIRPKLLFGKSNLNTQHESLKIYTDEEKFDLDISARYEINASAPVVLQTNSNGQLTDITLNEINAMNYLFNNKNPGFALDLGGEYDRGEGYRLYASIIDLGFIRWRTSLNNFVAEQSFQFRGLTQSDLNSSNYIDGMIDSIRNSYEASFTENAYFTMLPVKTYFGITYRLFDFVNAGLLNRVLLYKKRIYPSLTFSLNTNLGNSLALSASYSYNNYSFNNLGLGFSYHGKSAQFYMVTDNLLAVKPLDTRNLNLRFGINFFFGCRTKKEENDIPSIRGRAGCYWLERHLKQQKLIPGKKK
jgi:hypothetical protein